MPSCFRCSVFIENFKLFRSHMRRHNIAKNDRVFCIDGNCENYQISNLSALIRHYRSQHLECEPQQLARIMVDQPVQQLGDDAEPDVMELESTPEVELIVGTDELASNLSSLIQEEVDIFTSKLYENQRITRKQVQDIISYTQGLLQGVCEVLKPVCFELLKKANLCIDETYCVEDVFKIFESPFENLRSEYMRVKTYKEEGTYIEPQTILLTSVPGTAGVEGEQEISMDPLTAEHIPLKTTLKKFLEQPDMFKKILHFLEEVTAEKKFLVSFMNAENWTQFVENCKKCQNGQEKFFLPLFCYADEIECGNCIGSHKTLYKITAVYVSMPFLPPEFMHRLQNILIVYLHHSIDRNCVKNQKLYECVIEEFVFLHNEGIYIDTCDFKGTVYFKLALILGDNLGLHQLLGFVEGFTANFPCRICRVFRGLMLSQCKEDLTLLRDRENYAADVALDSKSVTGIVEECIWHQVPGFHCTESAGFYMMHDVLESCCELSLNVLITHYFKEKKF